MKSRLLQKAPNFLGSKVLPFENSRVVSPPGAIGHHQRRCIVVATPMRAGTHVMIDLLLNNLPAYRVKPLYVNLDRYLRRGDMSVHPQAGYVVKTHYPFTLPQTPPPEHEISAFFDNTLIITVQRDRTEMLKSLARWHATTLDEARARFDHRFDAFDTFWAAREQINVDHHLLFDPDAMQSLIQQIAEQTGTNCAKKFVPPPPREAARRIYLMKAATRLLGRHAFRINTTIHTLK